MAYFEKIGIYGAETPSVDAFGRWRISEAYTLFDSKFLYDSGSHQWATKIVGNASASFNQNEAAVRMEVSTTSGSRVTRQTKRYMPYQPGKSQFCVFTGNFDGKVNGIIKRIGYFDDDNGLFFQQSGSSFGIVKRSSVTGTVVDTFVSQSNWNVDKMDGTGTSGHSLDWSKSQIFFIDFEWLGVGRVRYGIFYEGHADFIHKFGHENELDSVYMSSPNLPVRYEIINGLGSATTSSLKQICSTVISEAGYHAFNGRERVVDSGGGGTVRVDSSAYGMTIALRQKSGCKAISVVPTYLSVVTPAGPDKQWALLLNPSLSTEITGSVSSSFWMPVTESGLEYMTGSSGTGTMKTIINEGVKLASGWFSTVNDQITVDPERFVSLGIDLDGNRDILVLAVRTAGAGSDGYVSLSFREII